MTRLHAVVAGAGIAGLASAAGLARSGWQVTVLEKQPRVSEIGAGLVLWPNGMAALDALGLGGRVDEVAELRGIGGFRRPDGRWLATIDGEGFAQRHGRLATVHRAELLSVLDRAARAAGACVRADTRVTGFTAHEGEAPVLHTERGDVTGDVVIGAEGIRSIVRDDLLGARYEPRPTGLTAWRWVVSWDEAGLPGSPCAHVTIGAGMEFGVIPLRGRRVYCYASSYRRGDGRTPGPDACATWHDPIPALVAAGQRSGMLRHELADLPRLPSFAAGAGVLVGDAAHAMTPHLGQGACQGLEDGAVLARLAEQIRDPRELASRFDAARRPRAQAVQRASRQAMQALIVTSPALVRTRNAAIRALPDRVIERALARWVNPEATRVGRGG